MESSSSSDESEYEDIQEFFPASEWREMSSYEKGSYRNAKRNFSAMQQAGLTPKVPHWMQRNFKVVKKPAAKRVKSVEEDEDFDEKDLDWSPRKENQTGTSTARPSRAKKFVAPKASRSATNSSARGRGKENIAPSTRTVSPAPGYQTAAAEAATASLTATCATPAGAGRGQESEPGPSCSTSQGAPPPRYSLRAASRGKVYAEAPVLDEDDFLFCDDCGREWEGDCPDHGPLQVIQDSEVAANDPERALHSLPSCLAVHDSKIQGAGQGVWAKEAISRRVRFGPYEGDITKKKETGYGWEIRREGKTVHCVDALDPAHSNWMRFVNCARNKGEENLHPYQYRGNLYYRTVCDIPANTELLVWYGDSYGKELGIDPKDYREPARDARAFTGTFPCEQQCGMCYVSPLLLAQHRRSGHCSAEINRRRACGAPGAAASVTAGASTSAVAAGSGEDQRRAQGKHSCGVCGAAFGWSSDLERHMRIHTGEKPFTCATCGAQFNINHHLQDHMRTHTGEKPFTCATCGAAFNRSFVLKKHMRTHSGEKPFSCATCGAAFNQSHHLKRHMRTQHMEQP